MAPNRRSMLTLRGFFDCHQSRDGPLRDFAGDLGNGFRG